MHSRKFTPQKRWSLGLVSGFGCTRGLEFRKTSAIKIHFQHVCELLNELFVMFKLTRHAIRTLALWQLVPLSCGFMFL